MGCVLTFVIIILTDFTVHFAAKDSCKCIQDVTLTRNRPTLKGGQLLAFSQSQRDLISE